MDEKEYIMDAPDRYGLDFDSDKNYISSFHHKKYLRKSTLDDFLETALDLKGLTASAAKREVKAEVILFEKDLSLISVYSCSLNELSEDKWEGAKYLFFHVQLEGSESSLFLKLDKSKGKELSFYGFNLEFDIYNEIVYKFYV